MSHAGKLYRSTPKRHNTFAQIQTTVNDHTVCDCGKWGWAKKGDALVAALSASGSKGKPFRVYRCTITKKTPAPYHLTSKADRSVA